MRWVILAALSVVALACAVPAHAADTQFHLVTDNGNVFILSPPDVRRPANIIGETAHLAVHNPPAGMFVLTAADGGTHRFTPLQSGLDTTGFAGGTVRVVTDEAWRSGYDYSFRDQPFGTMNQQVMRHHLPMPLATGWNSSYHNVTLVADSRFGLGASEGVGNVLDLDDGDHGSYEVPMGPRKRAGLDFGPGTGTDQTYYIYRGCNACGAEVAIGHASPNNPRGTLPNDPMVVDHERGWLSTRSCDTQHSITWSGTTNQGLADFYRLYSWHSQAGDYYIDSRYDDLSVLPYSHSSCSGTLYTDDTADNRKHDMCVTNERASGTTTWTYPYIRYETTYTLVDGSYVETGETARVGTTTRTTAATCSAPNTYQITDGYGLTTTCGIGPNPSNPPTDYSLSPTYTNTTRTEVRYDYHGSYSIQTSASVRADCSVMINTPHLDLSNTISIRPGLNVYKPPPIPAGHNIIMVMDDTERGGGGTEHIQIYRTPGNTGNLTGPFDFHLRPPAAGILYDAHKHYGWVDASTYDTDELALMGYTPNTVMAGSGDGVRAGGGPYQSGSHLCHGNCFMGKEGIDTGKPRLKYFPTVPPNHYIPSSLDALNYDHINGRWFESHTGGTGHVVASSLYLVVPFAEDVSLSYVWLYGYSFDPAAQRAPTDTPPCHTLQTGRLHNFADSMSVGNGESLKIPILPDMKYVAFIGNNECYWYDISVLPSPLSSVSSGARSVPLVNGTVLSGDLKALHDGVVHVDVVTDLEAVWQSEMYGMIEPPGTPANASWVVPPVRVEIMAVARVNGATGSCAVHGVYCSEVVELEGTAVEHGTYVHGSWWRHNEPYVVVPGYLSPALTTGTGVYGMPAGRCYGLETISADTDGIVVLGIPHISVRSDFVITLEFDAKVFYPEVVGGNVAAAVPASNVCRIVDSVQTATLDIRTMTATLR